MNQEGHRRPEDSLAFCGTIGADVSHDLRNVLSVIGEYAGLVDDLLGLAENGKPVDYARLRKAAANIARQVSKGTEMMERFSRFAHAADEPTTSFDLTALVENMAALVQRRVTLAGCRLQTELPGKAVPVRGNPFAMQQVVFCSIQRVLESLQKGEPVRVKLTSQGPTAVICVSGAAAGGSEPSVRIPNQLSAALDECQGSIRTSLANGILSLILTIPIQ